MIHELDELASRRVVLFGGKGGVGKTTVSAAAALHYAKTRPVILFTTDPASNLSDLNLPLRIESLDANALYSKFLGAHLESFLEIGDRGTYLDREELRQLFELTMPGVDELMAWMHIGQLVEDNPETLIVVDTAPTGHTLRMLSSAGHFAGLAAALDAMQEKHRAMVRQFTRREARDAMDAFIDDFDQRAKGRRELLTDPARAAFVPVTLSEPWVVEQTVRLIAEVEINVPFVILNRAVVDVDCERDRRLLARDTTARARFERVVDAPRSCVPLDSAEKLESWSAGVSPAEQAPPPPHVPPPRSARWESGGKPTALHRMTFFAGKGGVGKTTCSASFALQLARRNPQQQFTVISVDPAHSLRDVFAREAPPANLTVEIIDTREKWRRFRESVGTKIEEAVEALTPRGMSLGHDSEAMKKLIEIAPPGADELFAVTRLSKLMNDQSQAAVIVDTAPTGHFLRLLDLPRTAGEWVREFMRLLLKYRDLMPAGSLGEELVNASRALKSIDEALHSDDTAVFVVTRPERIVVAETARLLADLRERAINVGGVIANYLTPDNECACDQSLRAHELAALEPLDVTVTVERRDEPVTGLDELAALVPLY